MKLINIGFGNVVAASKIVAIVSPDSSPIKRVIQESREKGTLIDADLWQTYTRCNHNQQRTYNTKRGTA